MKIRVRLFASLAEMAGSGSLVMEAPEGSDVEGLWRRLQEERPGLAGLRYRPMAACDRERAEWDRTLEGVREVAFLPPVSGG